MTEVNQTNSSAYQKYAQQAQPKSNEKLGQQDFLRLMTTQLSNQDPFAPMENGEFLAQMAQFGTVSGIESLQQSFTDFSASMQSNQALQASVMVGRQVLVASEKAELKTDSGLQGAVDLSGTVGDLKIKITDSAGQLVHEVSLGPRQKGLVDFSWDGSNLQGGTSAEGVYSVSAEAVYNGKNYALPVLTEANVNSVTIDPKSSKLTLNLAALGDVSLSQVRQIR